MSFENLEMRSHLHERKSDMFLPQSTPKSSIFVDNSKCKFKEITRSSVGTVSRIYESGINDLMLQLTQLLDEMVRNARLSTVMLILSTNTFVVIKGGMTISETAFGCISDKRFSEKKLCSDKMCSNDIARYSDGHVLHNFCSKIV